MTGKVRIVRGIADLKQVQEGDIIVADKLEPDPQKWGISSSEFDSILKKAVGFIQNIGGASAHCNYIAKEKGIPAVVGTMKYGANEATKTLKDGQIITIDGRVDFAYEKKPGTDEYKKNPETGEVIEYWWGEIYSDDKGMATPDLSVSTKPKTTVDDLLIKYHLKK